MSVLDCFKSLLSEKIIFLKASKSVHTSFCIINNNLLKVKMNRFVLIIQKDMCTDLDALKNDLF